MSGHGLLSSAIARVETFQLADGAPAICGNDLKKKLERLVSDLRRVELLSLERNCDSDFNKRVTRLAHDVENVVERRAVLTQGLVNRFSGLLESDMRKIRKEIRQLERSPIAAADDSIPFWRYSYEDYLVGLEEDLNTLRSVRDSSRDTNKIAIVGMAGVGKTELARKLYEDYETKRDFDNVFWTIGSQKTAGVTVVKHIMRTLGIYRDSFDDMRLMEPLHKALYKNRYLIIVDDIWSTKVWEEIKPYFPDNNNSSTVVITSRDEGVAYSMGAGLVHRVRFRTYEESLDLFKRKLGLHHPGANEVLKDINKNASLQIAVNTIISRCQGHPLEIIRVANILKQTNLEDWVKVVHDMATNEIEETILLKSIALSYDFLPPHQKPCFLYLGRFPDDMPILVEKVYFMWIAEGLVSNKNAAKNILRDLADRHLVLVIEEEVSIQLQVWTRKLCILKGKAEGCVGIVQSRHGRTIIGTSGIYIHGNVKGNEITPYIHAPKSIRALFFCDEDSPLLSRWSEVFAEIENFECARVLDFDGIDFRANKLSIGAGKLLHLRYLGFQRCYIEEFVVSFWNFPYLETLDLRVRTKVIVPNVLSKMPNLKNLFFPIAYECKTQGGKLKLNGATKIEVLTNFHASICDVNDLLLFKNLQILKVILDGESTELENLISILQKIRESCSGIKSSLVLKDYDCYSRKRLNTFTKLLECGGIQNLYFEGCIRNMPQNLKISQNFTDIVFYGTEFREDPMPMLREIESLKRLVLCNDAIKVAEISCCDGGFKRLKSLEINNLRFLKLWVLESWRSMPSLHVLTIKHCQNLVTLPDELWDIHKLSQINIVSMPQEFKKQLDLLKERLELSGKKKISVKYES